MSLALQRRFDFALGGGRPLHTVSGLMGLFDLSEDDVLYLIEDGQFRWAFDIACPGARARELRIWRHCLMLTQAVGAIDWTIAEVVADILPKPAQATVKAVTLCRCFNCSSTHVHDLVRAGSLSEQPDGERGRTNTRLLLRNSVETFLTERRIL